MLRENAEFALVELIFSIENEAQAEVLRALDIFPENGEIAVEQKDLCQWKKCQPDQFGDSFCIRDA